MTELNAGQKHLLSYINEYRNLLKSKAKEIENYIDTLENFRPAQDFWGQDFWEIYSSKEEWIISWLKVVSQEEREWIARDFISALQYGNAPKQVIAVVKKANAVLFDLADFEGFEKCRKNRKFSDKQIDILHEADCALSKWKTEISKDVLSGKAKNKTNSRDLAREREKKTGTKEPSNEAKKAYKLYGVLDNQTEVAKKINEQLKRTDITQSKVSRWIKQYKKWLNDVGLPDVNEKSKIKVETVSPEFIEMGKRTDSRRATGSQLNKHR
jgi:hypothetical protein